MIVITTVIAAVAVVVLVEMSVLLSPSHPQYQFCYQHHLSLYLIPSTSSISLLFETSSSTSYLIYFEYN